MSDPVPASPPGRAARAWSLTREFLRDLFDLQFRTTLATRMLPGIYGLGILLAALFSAYLVVLGFRGSAWQAAAWMLLGPLAFVGLVTALRITLEFVLAVFRIAWYVEHVAGQTEAIQKELPRFGFMRTLLFGTGPPGTPPERKPPGA